ncbi:MAG: DNA polymerase I [Bifidobacteriaceae bacterium]|jgi:DNA polymerase-1|nr:DNA polymerase I [Bifidobacteriaceae bacterium]
MTEAPVLLLIDGHSLAFRAFYAMRTEGFATQTGQHTNAVFGFTNALIKLLQEHHPTHVAAAFDKSRISFRTEIYPDYKGTRGETPEEFKGQVPLIQEVLQVLGIHWFEEPDVEADDVLATLAAQGAAAGMTVLVASGDRDTFQLVNGQVTVLYPKQGAGEMALMTPEAIEAKYGVRPEQYPDLAALVGETSDNLPGVPGVGPKTAAKWIQQYGSLTGIEDHQDQIPGKVGEALRANWDQVKLNRRLNRLRVDLKLPALVEELTLGKLDRAGMNQLFDLLEFGRIRDRLLTSGIWEVDDGAPGGPGGPAGGPDSAGLPPFALVEDAEGALAQFLAKHKGQTIGLSPTGRVSQGRGDAWALALAAPDGQAIAADLEQLGAGEDQALGAFLADPAAPKAAHEAKAAGHMLAGRGLNLEGITFDTALAAYLCYPDQRGGYDLDDLSLRLLGQPLAPEDEAEGGQGMLDLGFDLGGGTGTDTVAAHRAYAIVHLAPALQAELERRQAATLLTDMELPVSRILERMEAAGIAVDSAKLEQLSAGLQARADQAEQEAYQALGGDTVNLASPKALQEVLFTRLGMPKTRKTKTGYSTDAESLAELFVKTSHPFLAALLAHRDVTKIRQMVDTLIGTIADDARIHTTYQQTVAATGRLSSAEPNLQNIPVRTETGRQVREAFVVGPGYEELMTADYSQIEMRIMAHLSGDQGLIEAFNSGEDLHATVAARVFGVAPAQVSPEQRGRVKAMSYGLAYGLSAFGLSRQLGIQPFEAENLMKEYFARFGGIKTYLEGVVAQARRDGYTATIMGRRRYLPDLTSDNRQRREMAERMALNAPIQGSAADIIKLAMIRVDAAMAAAGVKSRLLLQVHDELVVEVAPGEHDLMEGILRREMGQAMELSVPLAVSVGAGPSWMAAAH